MRTTITAKASFERDKQHSSALRIQRFRFPGVNYDFPSGTFNPASVFHPTHGWVAVLRWDRCFYQHCGIHGTETTPLVSLLGMDPNLPNVSAAVPTAEPWAFEETRLSQVLEGNDAKIGSTGDYRPFLWGNDLYVAFWIKFGWGDNDTTPARHRCWSAGWGSPHSCEYMAIARMDFPSKSLQIAHVFQSPVLGTVYRPEKNWAFFSEGSELFFFYEASPCLVLFRFNEEASTLAELQQGACYLDPQKVFEETALHVGKARFSGHPTLWTRNGMTERLLIVHTRLQQSAYAHWLLRADAVLNQITAISAGPILKSSSYHLEGYFPGVLVVGSFHVVLVDQKEVLRIFLGEGDQYSGWEDIPLDRIRWWDVAPNRTHVLHDADQLVHRRQHWDSKRET